eukprot:COSAG01_NODE_11670_length_1883_cov_8.024103_1_plen_351_part_00
MQCNVLAKQDPNKLEKVCCNEYIPSPTINAEWTTMGFVHEQLIEPVIRITAKRCVVDCVELARTVDTAISALEADPAPFLCRDKRMLDDWVTSEWSLSPVDDSDAGREALQQAYDTFHCQGFLHAASRVLTAIDAHPTCNVVDVMKTVLGYGQSPIAALAALPADSLCGLDNGVPFLRAVVNLMVDGKCADMPDYWLAAIEAVQAMGSDFEMECAVMVVQIGKTPPLYATADYQTEKERILYVLRFTLRMQVGGARRGICAGNEFDRFVKGPQPPWSQQPSNTVIVPTHQKDWSAMSPTEKADVEALGWTEQTWQEGSLEPFHRDFVSLSLAQQAAAKALGYSAADFWCV